MEDLEQIMMSIPLGQNHFERDKDLFARGRLVNEIVQQEADRCSGGAKLLVVSHARILRAVFATRHVETDKTGTGYDPCYFFENCELIKACMS